MPDTTQLLIESRSGDREAVAQLFDHVYNELRRLARAQLRRRSSSTLMTTELVHEAYLKLFDSSRLEARDRVHFLSLAARVMRQVLVDHFRRRKADKRGGQIAHESLDEGRVATGDRGAMVLALDEALDRLAERDERLGKVIEYRFYGGMTEAEIGQALDCSIRTVSNDWRRAKAWLARELSLSAESSDV